jgi:hypothetical protein
MQAYNIRVLSVGFMFLNFISQIFSLFFFEMCSRLSYYSTDSTAFSKACVFTFMEKSGLLSINKIKQ